MTTQLRIATFNLENLDDAPGGPPLGERLAVLRPQLERLRADVLCLQEVNGQREGPQRRRTLRALDALVAGLAYGRYHRVVTTSASGHGPRDRHNLVILSRFAVVEHAQIQHRLVAPPSYHPISAEPGGVVSLPIEWDRPLLHAALALDDDRRLHLINVHLRAPRAAFVGGQKVTAEVWRSMAGWAEGFFLAAVKRAGQAMETRLVIERLMDADEDALIAVCGDFNADDHQVPMRIVLGAEEDTGNPHLAPRALVAVERGLPESRRFSVIHHGRPQMVDHILASRPLMAWYRGVEVHNESLGDELINPMTVPEGPASYHAPVVAQFDPPGRHGDRSGRVSASEPDARRRVRGRKRRLEES